MMDGERSMVKIAVIVNGNRWQRLLIDRARIQ